MPIWPNGAPCNSELAKAGAPPRDADPGTGGAARSCWRTLVKLGSFDLRRFRAAERATWPVGRAGTAALSCCWLRTNELR
eukprot:4792427-Alexandrium_andersonii.AAC.1